MQLKRKGSSMFELMKIRNFLLSGIAFLLIMILSIVFILGIKPTENDSMLMIALSYGLLGVFPFLWFLYQFKKQKGGSLNVIHTKNVIQHIPTILMLMVTLIAFSLGASWLTNYTLSFVIPDYVDKILQEDVPFPSNNIQFILLAINICVVGPIAEEFIFRGLLLKRLGAKLNIVASIVITNLIFGIFHADIMGSFVFGFMMSLLYLKSENLLLPITLHLLNNTVILVLSIYFPNSPDFINLTNIADLHNKMIPNIILLFTSISVITIYIKRNISVLSKYNLSRKVKIPVET